MKLFANTERRWSQQAHTAIARQAKTIAELIPITVRASPTDRISIVIVIAIWTQAALIAKYTLIRIDRKDDIASPIRTGTLARNMIPAFWSEELERSKIIVNAIKASTPIPDTKEIDSDPVDFGFLV